MPNGETSYERPEIFLGPFAILPILAGRRNMSIEGITGPHRLSIAPFAPKGRGRRRARRVGLVEICCRHVRPHLRRPWAGRSYSRMVRRVEGLSNTDLKVMALIDASADSIITLAADEGPSGELLSISTQSLKRSPHNKGDLTRLVIAESLADLAARGFLIADGTSRVGKAEESYRVSQSFIQLMDRARARIKDSA